MPFKQADTPSPYSHKEATEQLNQLDEFVHAARLLVDQVGRLFHQLLVDAGCNSKLYVLPESYANCVKFYAIIELDETGSFADVAPIVDQFINNPDRFPANLLWKVESRDSDYSPMRVYSFSNDSLSSILLLFQLYVHLPMAGTTTCQVKKITIPPSEAKPTIKYEIVCGGAST